MFSLPMLVAGSSLWDWDRVPSATCCPLQGCRKSWRCAAALPAPSVRPSGSAGKRPQLRVLWVCLCALGQTWGVTTASDTSAVMWL